MGLLFSRTVTRLPLLEPLGFRLAGAANQGVEAGFVDESNLPVGVRGQARIIHQSFLIFIQILGSIAGVFETKCITYVLGDEPDFTALTLEDANGTECNH